MTVEEIIKEYPNSWKDIIMASDIQTAKNIKKYTKQLRRKAKQYNFFKKVAESIEDKKQKEEFLKAVELSKEDKEIIKLLEL